MTSRLLAHFAALIGGLFILGVSVSMVFFESAYRKFQQFWLFSGVELSAPTVGSGWRLQEKVAGIILMPVGLLVMLFGIQDAPNWFEALLVVGCVLISALCLLFPRLVLRWSISHVAVEESLSAKSAVAWTVGIRALGTGFAIGAVSIMDFWRH